MGTRSLQLSNQHLELPIRSLKGQWGQLSLIAMRDMKTNNDFERRERVLARGGGLAAVGQAANQIINRQVKRAGSVLRNFQAGSAGSSKKFSRNSGCGAWGFGWRFRATGMAWLCAGRGTTFLC